MKKINKNNFCSNCGNKLSEADKFCGNCGTEIKRELSSNEFQDNSIDIEQNRQENDLFVKEGKKIGEKSKKEGLSNEIKGWNWGAMLLPFLWGLFNKVTRYTILGYLLAIVVPFFGFIIWAIVFGAKGNKWAWESREWKSLEEFKDSQRKWKVAGFIIAPIAFFLSFLHYSGVLEALIFNE
jgi:hypothetical protein